VIGLIKPNIDQCIIVGKKQVSAAQKSLSLLDMSPAFGVLVIGIGLALIAFIFEVIFWKIKSK